MKKKVIPENHVVVFNDHKIRRVFHENTWWFVVLDVVSVLSDSVNPSRYVTDMKRRDTELNKAWNEIVRILSVETAGGAQKLNCSNTEGIFRIIQSIPSPKAEPFKRWLATGGR
jgi:DNA-damage-inducible protein D